MFERILVPYNGSASARAALEQAMLIAQTHGATLHGLYVIDLTVVIPMSGYGSPLVGSLGSIDTQYEFELFKIEEDRAKFATEAFKERCAQVKVKATVAIANGAIQQSILDAAVNADLLVMARHADRSLGSLADALVRSSPIPVWLVPGEVQPQPSGVLLAYDGGKHAHHALRTAAELARNWGLPLELLVVREGERVTQQTLEEAYAALHELGVTQFTARLEEGEPGAVIVSSINHDQLVVIGTRGRSAFLGLHLGHTVDSVLRRTSGPLIISP